MPVIRIRDEVVIGGAAPLLIAGPCVIESREHCLRMAEAVAVIAAERNLPAVFKASFDKANRTSIDSYRGPGLEAGLRILEETGRASGLPLTTDVHEPDQAAACAQVVDLLQVPAFLCRQTDLVCACAATGAAVSIKKGQGLAPWDCAPLVDKARAGGNERIMLIERGSSFGYNTLVTDMRALPQLRALGCPVIFDGTHSVQQPGGLGGSSGGQREFAPVLMRAAMAAGIDGLFIETHDDPASARSDGPNMIPLDRLGALLDRLLAIRAAAGHPDELA
ncbi:MAG: 3-deoxy-8-phosphooctulonate synthase [Planctomycetota bacterium]